MSETIILMPGNQKNFRENLTQDKISLAGITWGTIRSLLWR
jgi:hypothetical protein